MARRKRSRHSPTETPCAVVNDPDVKNQLPAALVMQEAPYHSAAVVQIQDILTRYGKSLEGGEPIVASNLLVLFDSAGTPTRIIPDIFVAFEAIEYLESSFRVPRERNLRMLVLEVLSKGTHKKDRSTKMLSYAEMGAQEYWLFDPTGKLQVPRLKGFRLADGKYVRIPGSGESREDAVHSEILCTDLYLDGQALQLASARARDVLTLSELQEFWKKHSRSQESLPFDEQNGDLALESRSPRRKAVDPSPSEEGV